MKITITELMSYSPCWRSSRIDRLAKGRIEIDLVDLLQDERISKHDRMWVACKHLENKDLFALYRLMDVFEPKQSRAIGSKNWSGGLAFAFLSHHSSSRDRQITWLLNELEATTLYADGRIAGERVAS